MISPIPITSHKVLCFDVYGTIINWEQGIIGDLHLAYNQLRGLALTSQLQIGCSRSSRRRNPTSTVAPRSKPS